MSFPVATSPFVFLAVFSACIGRSSSPGGGSVEEGAAAHVTAAAIASLPAGADDAEQRLAESPRHSEWIMVGDGADSVRAWVVYPERNTPAPVIIVVHEIFGVSDWIRAVADQLAADGFIAVAPDFLSGKDVDVNVRDSVVAAIRTLSNEEIQRRIDAVARHAMALPAARQSYGIVGFCWGGTVSFNHAVHSPRLGASVVYYGASPATSSLASVRAPVLGLYGEDDARVNATIPPADSALRALGRSFEHELYPGAGHGFLRQQTGRDGANMAATRGAWPQTIAFFRRHLES